MRIPKINVYLTDFGWAYDGVYQNIGILPGVSTTQRKLWTMLGALLVELANGNYKEVIIHNDTDLIDEWIGIKPIENKHLAEMAKTIKTREQRKFLSVELRRIDTFSLNKYMNELCLK